VRHDLLGRRVEERLGRLDEDGRRRGADGGEVARHTEGDERPHLGDGQGRAEVVAGDDGTVGSDLDRRDLREDPTAGREEGHLEVGQVRRQLGRPVEEVAQQVAWGLLDPARDHAARRERLALLAAAAVLPGPPHGGAGTAVAQQLDRGAGVGVPAVVPGQVAARAERDGRVERRGDGPRHVRAAGTVRADEHRDTRAERHLERWAPDGPDVADPRGDERHQRRPARRRPRGVGRWRIAAA
jgi:hypothetical protein